MGTGSGSDEKVPDAMARGWRQGEEQLYAAALGRPDLYQRTVELVGRTLEHLRTVAPDAGPLLGVSGRGGDLAAGLARAAGLPVTGLDLPRVVQAALALRRRELSAERAALDRVRALRAARERGGSWVVLSESGDPAGDPFRPYRRLEAEASTGRALLVTTAPDEDLRGCVHAVEPLHVDLVTGVLVEPRAAPVAATLHTGVAAREQQADLVRGCTEAW